MVIKASGRTFGQDRHTLRVSNSVHGQFQLQWVTFPTFRDDQGNDPVNEVLVFNCCIESEFLDHWTGRQSPPGQKYKVW